MYTFIMVNNAEAGQNYPQNLQQKLDAGFEVSREDDSFWYVKKGSSSHPVSKPPALALGLCQIERVLNPDELRVLHKDLASLALQRRQIPPGFDTDIIN